jgi:hypothetical protein
VQVLLPAFFNDCTHLLSVLLAKLGSPPGATTRPPAEEDSHVVATSARAGALFAGGAVRVGLDGAKRQKVVPSVSGAGTSGDSSSSSSSSSSSTSAATSNSSSSTSAKTSNSSSSSSTALGGGSASESGSDSEPNYPAAKRRKGRPAKRAKMRSSPPSALSLPSSPPFGPARAVVMPAHQGEDGEVQQALEERPMVAVLLAKAFLSKPSSVTPPPQLQPPARLVPPGCVSALRPRSRGVTPSLAFATGLLGLAKARKGLADDWNLRLSWLDRDSTSIVPISACLQLDGSLPSLLVKWINDALLELSAPKAVDSARTWWKYVNLQQQLSCSSNLCLPAPPCPLLPMYVR